MQSQANESPACQNNQEVVTMNNEIQDREEFDVVAAKYKQLKEHLPPEDAKVAFASAFFTERIQALSRDLPSIVEAIIEKIESEE
jgi:hypothetical protein